MAYTKKIEIQHCTETKDKIGNITQNWEHFHTVWAEIETVGGREYYAAAQVNSQNDVTFKMRYSRVISAMLTSEIRIVYNGKIYNAESIVDKNERHRETIIRAVLLNGESDE